MKAPKDMRQEELDLLLFEYLEGELAPEEEKALEEHLANDPILQEELESWKGSFVVEELYNTAALEERLLSSSHRTLKFPFMTSLNVVVPFLLTVLLSVMLVQDSGKESPAIVAEKSTPAAVEEVVPEKAEIAAEQAQAINNNTKPKQDKESFTEITEDEPGAVESYHPQLEEELSLLLLPAPEKVSIVWPEGNRNEFLSDINIKRVKISKEKDASRISRRQQRIIGRKKEKAIQERRAREFMQGNVPYVVPLNTQNF